MNWQDEQKKVATGVTGYVAQMQEGKDFTLTTPQPKREWVGIEQSDMPDGDDPMFDHEYFIAGMVFAAKVLEEKNK
jgi:hypothetical protein